MIQRRSMCPRCAALKDMGTIALKKKVISEYGKLAPDEWGRLWRLSEGSGPALTETLMEYFTVSTDDEGNVALTYSCKCEKCGHSVEEFTIAHQTDLSLSEEDAIQFMI